MSPRRIVETAIKKELDIIAVCDHNSCENVQATIKAARDTGLTVLSGMEITSAEEAHIIALFPAYDAAHTFQGTVYQHLTPGENDDALFGEQIIVNEFDEVEGYERRLLIAATDLPVGAIVSEIHRLHGIAIASHVDREAYSIIGQLGFIPDDLPLDAVEVSASLSIPEACRKFPQIDKYTLISSSDAHFLHDIGKVVTQLMIENPTLEEINKAFKGSENRSVAPKT